jgi:alpha-L-fucosidase
VTLHLPIGEPATPIPVIEIFLEPRDGAQLPG